MEASALGMNSMPLANQGALFPANNINTNQQTSVDSMNIMSSVSDNQRGSKGHQFLSSAGIDSQSLFRRARDLQSKASKSPRNINHVYSLSNAAASTTNKPLNPNLHQSLAQTRADIIENIIMKQRIKTQEIVQEKIHARLQENFEQTLASLGHVVQSRTVPSSSKPSTSSFMDDDALVSQFPNVDIDWNSQVLQLHLNYITTLYNNNSSNQISLESLLPLSQQLQHTQYQNAIAFFQTLAKYPSTIRGRCVASLEFLSEQYSFYIMNQVKNSLSTNDVSISNRGGMLGFIDSFVSMELGSNSTGQKEEIVWRLAYHALRCGDLECVKKIFLDASKEILVDQKLLQFLEEATSGNSSGIDALLNVRNDVASGVKELFSSAQMRMRGSVPGDNTTVYELAVLGLLTFTPFQQGTVEKTSEDYVFMALWNGVKTDKECEENVLALADNIKHYGPSHFEDDLEQSSAQSGWVYATLLFLSQQIKSGLGYLAGKSSDGLCIAVHMGLALQENGIAISDFTKETKSTGTFSSNYLAMLITAFARSMQTASPETSLDYLIHIPGTTQSGIASKSGKPLSKTALNQISRLILDTKAFSVIGGSVAQDGSRLATGALDKFFGGTQVSEIIGVVAEQSMREGKIADAAELLSLAGRYSDLLSVLNRQLSSMLVNNNENERFFWKSAAEQFMQTYLTNGQTHVLKVLEKERNLSLGNTFQMLLNLMSFFDRCKDKKWKSAWELVDTLGILPTSDGDISSKVDSFNNLSTSIQHVFHHIILQSMQALYEQHIELKSSLGMIHQEPNSGVGAIEQRLLEVRNRARLLATFSGLIPLHCGVDFKAEIGRMEAYMV